MMDQVLKSTLTKIATILHHIQTLSKEQRLLILNRLKTQQQAEKYLNKLMDMTIGEMKETDLVKMATEM